MIKIFIIFLCDFSAQAATSKNTKHFLIFEFDLIFAQIQIDFKF